jgi:speckle-type POZ protein
MGLLRSVHRAAEPVVFDYSALAPPNKCKGKRDARALMPRAELEASPYRRDDRLMIECVVDGEWWPFAVSRCELKAPTPDLSKHLGDLLDCQYRTEVAFDVGGQVFRAHRAVLAVRSPVFMVEG